MEIYGKFVAFMLVEFYNPCTDKVQTKRMIVQSLFDISFANAKDCAKKMRNHNPNLQFEFIAQPDIL